MTHPLPGTLLSIEAVSSEREVHRIGIEMLPAPQAALVVNFADAFGAGWLDPNSKQLRLEFQLVALFSNAKTDSLWLSVAGREDNISLFPINTESPVVGQKHQEIPWSAQSRFLVNEIVELPEWAINSDAFELMAGVGNKPEKIGIIHVRKGPNAIEPQHASNDEVANLCKPELPATVVVTENSVAIEANPVKGLALAETAIMQSGRILIQRLSASIANMNRLFLTTVILPTLMSIVYFGFIASDVYISESRFVVRSPEKQATSGLGAILQSSGFSRAQDDTYTIHDYILSRDALQILEKQFAISQSYGSNNVDLFSRFGGFNWDHSFEALLRYFQKHVSIDSDSASSITTLTVSAYTSQDAYRINESLLEMSEALVNQLNERGRQDMIRFADREVADAEKKAADAALAVSDYRDQKNVFDPTGQSALQLQLVSKLQDELIATENVLIQVQTLTSDNPQIVSLRKRVETLRGNIASETAKVAGAGSSLSSKAVKYERLKMESMFAEKQLAAALASLTQARNEAQRKQLYLERIIQPSKPDKAMEPRRLRAILTTLILGLIVMGLLTILLAGVREHKD